MEQNTSEQEWSEMSCKTFDVTGLQQKRKDQLVTAIIGAHGVCRHCNTVGVTSLGNSKGNSPQQTEHCPLRLINILFSDTFAESFSVTGNLAKRNTSNANKVSKDRGFWINAQAAFVATNDNNACDKSFFEDSECLADTGFDPRHAEQHSWETLQTIWKDVNGRHKEAE